jgi:hypothetical protein
MKMDLRKMECEGVDLIHLARDWILWRVLMTTATNLWFHKRRNISLPSKRLSAF